MSSREEGQLLYPCRGKLVFEQFVECHLGRWKVVSFWKRKIVPSLTDTSAEKQNWKALLTKEAV
jgi:hypothetical protein